MDLDSRQDRSSDDYSWAAAAPSGRRAQLPVHPTIHQKETKSTPETQSVVTFPVTVLPDGTSCPKHALLSFRRLYAGCQNGRTEARRQAHAFAPSAPPVTAGHAGAARRPHHP